MKTTRSGAVYGGLPVATIEAYSKALRRVYRLPEGVRYSTMTATNQRDEQRIAWLYGSIENYRHNPIPAPSTVLFYVCATNVQAYV